MTGWQAVEAAIVVLLLIAVALGIVALLVGMLLVVFMGWS